MYTAIRGKHIEAMNITIALTVLTADPLVEKESCMKISGGFRGYIFHVDEGAEEEREVLLHEEPQNVIPEQDGVEFVRDEGQTKVVRLIRIPQKLA
jgi:hypothetical protein